MMEPNTWRVRIAYAVLFTNGNVIAFDDRGQQMPIYSGRYGEVVDRILDVLGDGSRMLLAQWTGAEPIPWRELAWFTPIRVRGKEG